ncbi:MAG: CRISPR-associated protein Cas4 [Anaerolineae bacterium]|nr:CRISPR-associated protein Cas4 [Anaerolineae bacterium]
MMESNQQTLDTSYYWRINELKNFLYCARIAYYALALGLDRTTGLAEAGLAAEEETRRRMQRRRKALHAVVAGERHFNVALTSHRWQLVGKLDEMIVTPDGVYLVDYKDTDRDYGYWEAQMYAYRLCAEEHPGLPVLECYIYTIPTRQYHLVQPTSQGRRVLEKTLGMLQEITETEVCPPPTSHLGKCRTCQYQRFCNDVF